MPAIDSVNHRLQIKKFGFLVFLTLNGSLFLSAWLGSYYQLPNVTAFFTLVYSFVIIPVLDHLIGKDSYNPDEETQQALSQQFYYQLITLICVPLQLITLLFGAWYLVNADLNILGAIGWITSVGLVGSSVGITVAHELIHKNSRHERFAGGLLLAMVCFSTFKIEHIRGHHVWVGTSKDRTTACYNQTVYQFLRTVFPANFIHGWRLELEYLSQRGFSPWDWRNELIWWHLASLTLAVMLTALFGWAGLVYFLAQSFIAIMVLEIINYIEHYGLRRAESGNGKYEPVSECHSWNSNFLFSNLMLFHLQRHSDHHQKAKKRYQTLLHRIQSPQLPSGYPAMMLLALCPPLWFKIVNPRIPVSMRP